MWPSKWRADPVCPNFTSLALAGSVLVRQRPNLLWYLHHGIANLRTRLSPGMAMQTVNIHAAKTHLSRLVDQAAAGEEIVIARAGRPVARLVPLAVPEAGARRQLGILAGQVSVSADFDVPLPETVLAAFEGR
jgi:prevent-host-death family protein